MILAIVYFGKGVTEYKVEVLEGFRTVTRTSTDAEEWTLWCMST